MAATAPPPPTLDTLPADVLARMLLSPEELLAVAGVNRALRSALDAPQHASLWPLWASVVMRRADPAASLALASRGARPPPDEADAAAWLTEEEVAASRVHKMYARCTQIEREPTIGFDGSIIMCNVVTVPYEAAARYDVRRTAGEFKAAEEARAAAGDAADEAAEAAAAADKAGGATVPAAPAWATTLAWHAARLGSWRALVYALTQRHCNTCGAVTRWVAWAPAADSDAGGHACGRVAGARRCARRSGGSHRQHARPLLRRLPPAGRGCGRGAVARSGAQRALFRRGAAGG
jgi:hypothetical protein